MKNQSAKPDASTLFVLNPLADNRVQVARRHILTGQMVQHKFDMPLPKMREKLRGWRNGLLIQQAFPELSADQREFLLNGILPDEFEEVMGAERESNFGPDESEAPAF